MRYIVALLAVFISTAAFGDSPSVASRVFGYECKQVDPKAHGFSCDGFKNGSDGPWFTWHTAPGRMPQDKADAARYHLDSFLLRYIQLGGKNFYVRYAEWPSNKYKGCWAKATNDYGCRTFCVENGTVQSCE